MQFALLFLEGIITFVSPCLLPLLPLYVSYFAAGEPDRRRAFANAVGFVCGFTLVFVALGALAGTLGMLLVEHSIVVNIVAGLIVVLLGLNFTGLISIRFLNRTMRVNARVKSLTFFSSVLFGIVFSVGWTPCVGAFLGSALMRASMQGGTLVGGLMLLVYSLGLGIPFIASAVLIDRLKNAFDLIKRNHKIVNIVSGVLLMIIGVLMATGLMGRLMVL
ncbi:MAG: cytochrome c biogenesis protein CcdA [Treponema sp.]|nr:cytochrome c biogenesis protein CcdA [Treponema sp.]